MVLTFKNKFNINTAGDANSTGLKNAILRKNGNEFYNVSSLCRCRDSIADFFFLAKHGDSVLKFKEKNLENKRTVHSYRFYETVETYESSNYIYYGINIDKQTYDVYIKNKDNILDFCNKFISTFSNSKSKVVLYEINLGNAKNDYMVIFRVTKRITEYVHTVSLMALLFRNSILLDKKLDTFEDYFIYLTKQANIYVGSEGDKNTFIRDRIYMQKVLPFYNIYIKEREKFLNYEHFADVANTHSKGGISTLCTNLKDLIEKGNSFINYFKTNEDRNEFQNTYKK